jgi:hypothetical protein
VIPSQPYGNDGDALKHLAQDCVFATKANSLIWLAMPLDDAHGARPQL